jgi:hypothetical protein
VPLEVDCRRQAAGRCAMFRIDEQRVEPGIVQFLRKPPARKSDSGLL